LPTLAGTPSFPYTTLFRSVYTIPPAPASAQATINVLTVGAAGDILTASVASGGQYLAFPTNPVKVTGGTGNNATFTLTYSPAPGDRKSTRLNSSHRTTSYA